MQIYTATHLVGLEERLTPDWAPRSGTHFYRVYAPSVEIGDGCWIGGGVIILPGTRIRTGSMIGAGSVVTRDIPPNCVAIGDLCRAMRRINERS